MAELATLLKSLQKVKPQTVGELEYQIDKNLVRTHPGLMDSAAPWYGGKMTTYLNEVTKNDSSQYAIAMMDPDELFKMIGRANMDDPGVRDRVLDLYNRAASGKEGLRSIVKLDGLVNEKGYIDVTRITPGSQETMEALRLLDRDRPPDMPPARIPVLVHASGANWATDPAPRLRYNGKTTGTLSMPKWDARRPPPPTRAVADATSPTFYTDQPKTLEAAKAKIATFFDPAASLSHGDAVKMAHSTGATQQYALSVMNAKRPSTLHVQEAKEYLDIKKRRISDELDALVDQYGEANVIALAGDTPLYTMGLLGETGAKAKRPMIWWRTEKYGVQPYREGQFSPALESSSESFMHAGGPESVRAFQGNNVYYDYLLGMKDMFKYPENTMQYQRGAAAVNLFKSRQADAMKILSGYTKGNKLLQDELFQAVENAKAEAVRVQKPGDRTSFGTQESHQRLLAAEVAKIFPKAGTEPNALSRLLGSIASAFDDGGTTTRPFILKANRPLFLIDTGNFYPETVLRQLSAMPEFAEDARRLQRTKAKYKDIDKRIQALIESRGYDHVAYLNTSGEGSLSKYADAEAFGDPKLPQGYATSIGVWKEDQIVPLDTLPKRNTKQLKKALAGLIALPAAEATKDKDNGSTD